MSRFRYIAIDADGNTIEGELARETLAEAIAELESQGKTINSIELVANPSTEPGSVGGDESPVLAPINLTHYGTSSRLRSHFDSVFARREELIPALQALAAEIPRGTARRDLRRLVQALTVAQSGSQLGSSKHATRWLPLLLTGLDQDSATQRLGDLLATTARESRNRNERRRVMIYPAIVFLIAFLVFALVCAIIVPSFRTMFAEFGLRIPATTRFVIRISEYLTDQLPTTLITLALTGVMITVVARVWIHFALTTRVFGRFAAGSASNVSAMASLTSQLADLLSIGMSVPDALWLAGEGCNHRFFQDAAQNLARHAYDSGQPLSACPDADRLPGNVIHALSAGPGGKPSLALLHELGVMYSDHATNRTNWVTGAAAQMSIVLLGLAVGFVVVALFAPLVSLISGLT